MAYRNEKLRRLVASLPCALCGHYESQAAHRNEGKGMGLKNSDALVASLCPSCHHEIDNGKSMSRDERRDAWNRAYIVTMQRLIESNKLVININ